MINIFNKMNMAKIQSNNRIKDNIKKMVLKLFVILI